MMQKDATVSSRRVSIYLFTILHATMEKAVWAKRLIELQVKVHWKNAHVAGKERLENPVGKKASQLSS